MTESAAIYASLGEVFSSVFDRNDIILKPDLVARDVEGWDSFKQIELLIAVEKRYGIKFRTRELEQLNSVGDLADLIAEKTSST